jgi:hypothetical protein
LRGALWRTDTYARIGGGYGSIQPQITIPAADGTEITLLLPSPGNWNLSAAAGTLWSFAGSTGLGLLAELEADYFFPRRLTALELRLAIAYGFAGR